MVKTILNLKSDKKKNNKKIISLTLFVLLFCGSCTFFGESMFPVAMSPDISSVLSDGDILDFYTLDNGEGDELIFLVMDTSPVTAYIFDTSLNYRGGVEDDGSTIILNDGSGFVDFDNDFIVGDEVIENDGTAGKAVYVTNLNGKLDYSVTRYKDSSSTTFYLYDDSLGTLTFYETTDPWGDYSTYTLSENLPSIKHSELDTDSFDLFDQTSSNVYQYSIENIFSGDTSPESTITLDKLNLTEWITRCDEGYFVSNDSGEFFLFDFDGEELKSIDQDDEDILVCTIDNDGEYYYYVDENNGYIVKKRLSSW